MNGMKQRAFPYWAVLLPSVLVGCFEFARHTFFERLLPRTWGNIGAAVLVGAASALYIGLSFRYIRQVERRFSRAREEAAVLQERDRIARDLHDNLSQAFFYMAVRLDELAQRGETDPAVRAAIEELRRDVQAMDSRVRAAIADLRRRRAPRTLGDVLRTAADEAGRSFRIRVEVAEPGQDLPLGEAALEQVSGIIQEALANAAKYAGVDRVSLSATVRREELQIIVADGGKGFDPTTVVPGFGLQMMAERAATLGGQLSVETAPGAGTRVVLTVSLSTAARRDG
jgi:signal transduction histidine kinase